LLYIIVDPVIHLVMLTHTRPGNRRPRDRAGSGTTGATTRLRSVGAASAASLCLAGADVLLDSLRGLALERCDGLGRGAKAKQREERCYAGNEGGSHKGSTVI
jgi:hypothetical protein